MTPPNAGTPTPRTDELYLNIQQHPSVEFAFDKMHDHALQLERDLVAANKKIERLTTLAKAALRDTHDHKAWKALRAELEKP